MPVSNYPNGFANGVNIRGLPLLNTYAGNVFWVDSATGSNQNKGTKDRPFATLDYAIGRCTANNGDIIVVYPNHAETITGAGGITLDVAGVSVIGLGTHNQRPRFLMDAGTAVTVVVSAADIYIENLVFAGGHNGIVTCFDIDAVGFHSHKVEFEDNTTDEHFLIAYTVGSATDNTCDGLTITEGRWVSEDAGPTEFITVTGDIDRMTVSGNFVCLDASGAQFLTQANGDDMNGVRITYNEFITGATSGDLLVENNQTDNSGIVAHNLVGHHDTAAMNLVDADGVREFENYSASADNVSGALEPAADSIT